jgi:uncharacterized protein YbjT (DUF2867 family)
MKTRIAVIGATGSQGGGLCRALLTQRDEFEVIAITRNAKGVKATALREQGAEVVEADLDDYPSLVTAFEGATGVFGVTNYWELHSAAREKAQAQNIAAACRAARVHHVVWSTLEDTRDYIPQSFDGMPFIDGDYRVPHLDGKNEANAYFSDLPTTYLITSFFWDNLINFGLAPSLDKDGVYRWAMPFGHARLAAHAAQDIGPAVASIFAEPQRFIGETVGIQADALTLSEMAETLAAVLDVRVEYMPIEPDDFRALPFDGAEEMGNNFQYFRDWNESFLSLRSKSRMQSLNPRVMDFAQFVTTHADRIRSVMNVEET